MEIAELGRISVEIASSSCKVSVELASNEAGLAEIRPNSVKLVSN